MKSNTGRRKFLNTLIQNKILIVAAQRAGFSTAIENKDLVSASKRGSSLRKFLAADVFPKMTITRDEMLIYFQDHLQDFPGKDFPTVQVEVEGLLLGQKMDLWQMETRNSLAVRKDERVLDSIKL